MSDWNFADVWETVARLLPDARATSHGGIHHSWAEFEARAEAQASWLSDLGLPRQARVAQYLYSCPEYLESLFACFKASLAPVNTNYRYGPDELAYLWGDAACGAVVFHGAFTDTIAALRDSGRVDTVVGWLWVDDGSGPCPPWATDLENEVAASGARMAHRPERSGDDLWLLYTGGTTGYPKGVMWRQDDIFAVVNRTAAVRYPEDGGLDDVRRMLAGPGPVLIPGAPLMHGTGTIAAFGALSSGGSVSTLVGRSFDPIEMLDLIEMDRAKSIAIVGDAFAKPLLAALDTEPARWDISSLRIISSSGVMWSAPVKAGLLAHNPNLILVDTLGSSEAIGMASSITSGDGDATTATFRLGDDTQVFTADGRRVVPGSVESGVLALRGRGPIGYLNDEEKSAKTFRVIDGERWAMPGDHATVELDGTITLLGRGSQCINTGGEKVYPEEVEEALKAHPTVHDAAVVGIPDDRFGQAVTALVAMADGCDLDEQSLIAAVKRSIAAYKAPKRIFAVDDIGRAPNGKLDYARLKGAAIERAAR